MRTLGSLLGLCLLASSLAAQPLLPQRFGGTHPDPVPREGTLHIEYINIARANTSIKVEVHDGADPTQSEEVTITIDASGDGSGEFDVPFGWVAVVVSYPDSADLSVVVQDGMPMEAPVEKEPVTQERAGAPPR
jgi:hypothetical protein